jgi:hypothetical protein
MGKESVVDIAGHQYRYVYNEANGKTEYMGPVGDVPTLSEEEFLLMVPTSRQMPEIQADKLTGDAKKFAQMIVVTRGQNKGRLKASKPKVDRNKPDTGKAAYIWRMVAFQVSTNSKHHSMPVTADWDIEAESYEERRRIINEELNPIVDKIVDTVPLAQHYGTLRWGHAFGYFRQ